MVREAINDWNADVNIRMVRVRVLACRHPACPMKMRSLVPCCQTLVIFWLHRGGCQPWMRPRWLVMRGVCAPRPHGASMSPRLEIKHTTQTCISRMNCCVTLAARTAGSDTA